MKKKTIILCFLSLWLCSFVYAQSEIQGKVIDAKTKETIPFATVSTTINGKPISVQTDFDGYYSIRPLPEGTYDVTVYYSGYGDDTINCVETKADRITFLEVELAFEAIILEVVEIVTICVLSNTNTHATPTKEEIADYISIRGFRGCGVIPAKYVRRYNRKARKEANKLASCRPNQEIEYYIDGTPHPALQPTNEAAPVSEEQAKTNTTAQITCFPNPTFDQLNIALKDNIAEIRLVNTEGKVIERYNTQNKKHLQIDMSHYCKGTYFVQYNIGSHHTSHKIVLLH